MKITSKAEFFRLWEEGSLGNRTNLWRSPQDAFDSKAPFIGFRQIGSAGGGAWERCSRDRVFETCERWTKSGRNFMMDDGCPDYKRVLQGEVCRTYRGFEATLDLSCRYPMRVAFAKGCMRPYQGIVALSIIRAFMDECSQEDLWELLDKYPDATIEFTTFSVDVGVFPNRNTLLWETRDF